MAAAQVYPFNVASSAAQQVLKNHLEFVAAKTPETVTIKPSNYIVIKANPNRDNGDDMKINNSTTTASTSVDSSPVVSGSTTPATSTESSDTESGLSSSTNIPVAEYYALNDPEQDKDMKRIIKTWRGAITPPTGLVNIGVTCFMNAAIQIMLHVPAMVHYLNDVNEDKVDGLAKARVTHDLADVLLRLNSKRREFVPQRMIKNLELVNCMMNIYQQQDSHEYFQSLLGRLQEESTPKGKKLNTSIVHDIFGGSLHQTIQCHNCGNVSTTSQDLYDLSLQFSSSMIKSVAEYFKDEKMDSYTCEKCKQTTTALKRSWIDDAPEYLTVNIKRFKQVNGTNKYHKVKSHLNYPADLKLTQYSKSKSPIQYRLIAVLVHSGRTTSSGHYVALCRQSNGKWAEYDDELVRQVDEREAMSQGSAYMLMYQKLKVKPAAAPLATNGGLRVRITNKHSPAGSTPVKRPSSAMDEIDKIFNSKRRK